MVCRTCNCRAIRCRKVMTGLTGSSMRPVTVSFCSAPGGSAIRIARREAVARVASSIVSAPGKCRKRRSECSAGFACLSSIARTLTVAVYIAAGVKSRRLSLCPARPIAAVLTACIAVNISPDLDISIPVTVVRGSFRCRCHMTHRAEIGALYYVAIMRTGECSRIIAGGPVIEGTRIPMTTAA